MPVASIAKLLIVILLVGIEQVASQNSFEEFKKSMEEKVKDLANQMSSIYSKRCENLIKNCQQKSYNLCDGTSQKQCYQQFPKSSQCLSDGAFLSTKSGIQFPSNVQQNPLTPQEKLFVCASALLQQKFASISQQRKQQFTFSYVGTALGAMRVYPIFRQFQDNKCISYDPRFRPWYVGATSGSKNVIIVIDTSGSMQGTRIEAARNAAKGVVNTLSNNDFFGVVKFSSSAQILYNNKLNRGTIKIKEEVNSLISNLTAGGNTSYNAAFQKVFEIFGNAQSDQFGSPCTNSQNIVLFLTDGVPSDGFNSSQEYINRINALKNSSGISSFRLFTYGFGLNDTTILKELSCQYNGITFKINNTASDSQLVTVMRNYYTFVGAGVEFQNPVWSEPYDDIYGFGRVVTVAMPIYFSQNGITKILGVAGIDVLISYFANYGLTQQDDITRKLISEFICLQNKLQPCQIEKLRSDEFKCGVQNCTETQQSLQCEQSTASQVFHSPISTDTNICCGINTGTLIGIIVGSIVGLAIIVIVVCCCIRKHIKGKAHKQTEEYRQKQQNPGSANQFQANNYMDQNTNMNQNANMNQNIYAYQNPAPVPSPMHQETDPYKKYQNPYLQKSKVNQKEQRMEMQNPYGPPEKYF